MKHFDVRAFDYHRMTLMPRLDAADSAHRVLDVLQKRPPEEIVLGTAVLFAALCKRLRLSPSDIHNAGMRVLEAEPFHKRANDSLQSLQDFAGLRIAGEDVSIS